MKKIILFMVFVFSIISAQGEHPTGSKTATASITPKVQGEKITLQNLARAIESFVEADIILRGAFLVIDPSTDEVLKLNLENSILHIQSDAPIFGPQPFFAIKNKSGEYFYDNLDFQESFREWTYTFDETNFPLDSLDKIGVACCDSSGNVSVSVLDVISGEISERYL